MDEPKAKFCCCNGPSRSTMHEQVTISGRTIMRNWKTPRSTMLIGALLGSVAIAYLMFCASEPVAATPAPAAQAIAGTASLSGTVESSAPFKAAQVFIRNTDKRILYMVYTNAGQFRGVAMFPGNYEVSSS